MKTVAISVVINITYKEILRSKRNLENFGSSVVLVVFKNINAEFIASI
jgi:hypothetical protein